MIRNEGTLDKSASLWPTLLQNWPDFTESATAPLMANLRGLREILVTPDSALSPTEAEFQEAVAQYAHLRGWRVAHWRPAHTTSGWRTAVQYDAKGFPDLVLVRDRLLFAELKSATRRLTRDQSGWISALSRAGCDAVVWRPSDWPEIERTLM